MIAHKYSFEILQHIFKENIYFGKGHSHVECWAGWQRYIIKK